jgi:hypothetical protein
LLDTPSGGLKNFNTDSDVVYGKFQDGVTGTDPALKPEPSISPEPSRMPDPDFYSDEILTPEDAYDDEYAEGEHEDDEEDEGEGEGDLQLLRKTLDLSTNQEKPADNRNDREVCCCYVIRVG